MTGLTSAGGVGREGPSQIARVGEPLGSRWADGVSFSRGGARVIPALEGTEEGAAFEGTVFEGGAFAEGPLAAVTSEGGAFVEDALGAGEDIALKSEFESEKIISQERIDDLGWKLSD